MKLESKKSVIGVAIARLVRRLWPEPDRWEAVAKGPATIDGLRYEVKSVRIEGTYVKERNQHGQERYLITEPDGTTYTRDASQVSPTNAKTEGPAA